MQRSDGPTKLRIIDPYDARCTLADNFKYLGGGDAAGHAIGGDVFGISIGGDDATLLEVWV